jgi:hypothetical protein
MNYSKIYDSLIAFRQTNPVISGYTEKHHILPRSLKGSNTPTNVVRLTGREHYIAHLLLHRFRKSSKTAYALWMMQCKSSSNEGRPHIKSSRMYEWARKEFSKYVSRNNCIASKGERNSQFGTRWICNLTLRESKRIPKATEIPEGWVIGRNVWNIVPKTNTRSKCSAETKLKLSNRLKGVPKSETWREQNRKPKGPRTKKSFLR